jgi:hypothetical protein
MKRKRAQIWSLDIMAGMMLFLTGIMIFFVYTLNQPGEAQENFELLFYDARVIANSLMSSGYPQKWDSANIVTLGITDDNRINETKLESLYNIIYTDSNYSYTKNILNTRYDYYIFLDENMTINSNQVEGIGKPGATKNNIDARNLVKITRFTIYQNKTTPLYLYIWEE